MTSNNVKEIDELIKIISKLPGLGPKSAKRIVLKLINNREEITKPLVNTLAQIYKNVIRCTNCGNLKSSSSECLCLKKNYDQICVVENIADMWVIENAGIYKGHYHILGGTLPSLERKKNDNLLIDTLTRRVKKNSVKEVILATSATIEGQTTAHYIADQLNSSDIILSRLAQGLPMGGELDFLDDGTITQALRARSKLQN